VEGKDVEKLVMLDTTNQTKKFRKVSSIRQ